MLRVKIPYGKTTMTVKVPERNLIGILQPKKVEPINDFKAALINQLTKPIDMDPLQKLVEKRDKIAIVIDDVTRPLPSKRILPIVLRELRAAGVSNDDIIIIIATGTHRGITKQEALALMGSDIARKYKWVNHDCDTKDLVYVGKTSFGNEVYVNRYYVEADFKIVISDITPHYYAGYGGVFKSIVPGIAGRTTINFNHSMMFDEKADICNIRDNPVFLDIKEGALLAGIDFSIAVVLNPKKEILKVLVGDPYKTFIEGVNYIDSITKVRVRRKVDIAISSPGGYPFDINFYQAHKGLYNSERIVRGNGNILFLAECSDGFGNKVFYEWLRRFNDSEEVMDELKKRFVLGGHKAYYVLKTVSRLNIHLLSSLKQDEVRTLLKMKPVINPNKVIESILKEDPESEIVVIPYSYETVPIIAEE